MALAAALVAGCAAGRDAGDGPEGSAASSGGVGGSGSSTADVGVGVGGGPGPLGEACHVSAGIWQSCARTEDKRVVCWGQNWANLIPAGPTPTEVPMIDQVAKLALGEVGACAIKGDGTLWCWNGVAMPAQVSALGNDVVDAAIGDGHSCVVKGDGTIWCWGYNGWGSLGDGTTTSRAEPVQVLVPGTFKAVVTSHFSACAISTEGAVWCWGRNSYGHSGDGTTTDHPTPVASGLTSGVVALAIGTSHTCAVKEDESLWCWGGNYAGQIGQTTPDSCTVIDPMGDPCALTPQQVMPGEEFLEVVAGESHTCARKADHSFWCWGDNTYGQIGNGTKGGVLPPTQVTVLGNDTGLGAAAGSALHTCARKFDGLLYCWGSNYQGEIGAPATDMCDNPGNGQDWPCGPSPSLLPIGCVPPPDPLR